MTTSMPLRERDYARWMLLAEEAKSLFVDWEDQTRNAVEALRFDTGRCSDDPETQKLVGELPIAGPRFRRWWPEHRVHQWTFGTKRLHHPLVGDLAVDFETCTLPGDSEQTLFIYNAPPASKSQQALNLLSSRKYSAMRPEGPDRAGDGAKTDRVSNDSNRHG